jgi:superfamily II DNA or RNA helicase/HKD family nuclease
MTSDGRPHLPIGVYEQMVTRALEGRLDGLPAAGLTSTVEAVEPAEWPGVLARHVSGLVRRALAALPEGEARLQVIDQLVRHLTSDAPDADPHGDDAAVAPPPRMLRAVQPLTEAPGRVRVPSPVLPVGQSDLLVNARGEPNLLHSLASEIASADQIDVVVAFIKRSGLLPLLPALRRARERGARIRVVTTTYLGGTDQRAIHDLLALGAQVKVSYDLSMTRLHAKGWLFERDTGFHTAYIGSSNLSHAAMTQGQEWNVRLTAAQTPDLVDKFRAAFSAYWNDPTLGFEHYDPRGDSAVEARLRQALMEARGGGAGNAEVLSPFAVRPMPHQLVMLEDLEREREVYGRYRNLVVAATGTGKTAVAAFDYARFAERAAGGEPPSLLVVAHRAEILVQSRRMFRHVLRSGDFGELLVGEHRPDRWRHVFASIQSLSSTRLAEMAPDAFRMVVVDEFHHAAAPTYEALLRALDPTILLGLTATPERTDGRDVVSWFGGHIATELRLWDALEQQLLSPFHYYGVGHERLDLRRATWTNGHYASADLDNVLTGDDILMSWVVAQIQDKVTDPTRMRALAFAGTVKHARFVADRLSLAGIRAVALDASTRKDDRERALTDLRDGTLQVIVTVDLFNEGIDVPAVDTLLLLRPTESVTVFLQQLGRGLRRDPGKDVLTVLDFVGFQHRRFRFDLRFNALTGVGRQELVRAVQEGFPYLPAGSFITLDAVAQEAVLENIRAHVPSSKKALVDDVRRHAARHGRARYRLAEYLNDAEAEPSDVYARKLSWIEVSRAAGLDTEQCAPDDTDEEAALLTRARSLAHVDDLARLDAYQRLVTGAAGIRTPHDELFATMLFFALWPAARARHPEEGLTRLQQRFPAVVDELLQGWEVARERISHTSHALTGPHLAASPLRVHARYSREEMLAGIGWAYCGERPRVPKGHAAGTRDAPLLNASVFDITWRKTDKAYSPTTMYQDYAVSPQEVHWESPNGWSIDADSTRRCVEHEQRGRHILLFARESKLGPTGTQPLLFLGPARYVSHEGSRPVSFRWLLDRAMPTDFYESARVVAG